MKNSEENKCCRICYEQDSKTLISPCLCSGTSEFIHEECLKNWIKHQEIPIELSKCEICGYTYKTFVKIEKIFNPRKGIEEEFLYCCLIPIYIIIIIAMAVAVIILALFKLDFERNPSLSWAVVGGLSFSAVGCLALLIISFNKVLYVNELTEWRISSIDKSPDSINVVVV